MTEFSGGTAEKGELLLQARLVATGPRLTRFDADVHRGEIVGFGGLLGSGCTEVARAIFGVDELKHGTITIKADKPAPATPGEAIAAGVGYVSEDRKAEGIVPDMSVRENLTLALLPLLTRHGQID